MRDEELRERKFYKTPKKVREQVRRRSRTVHGLIYQIYKMQILSSIQREHDKPKYSYKEFTDWFKSQKDFKHLYSEWVKSNYNKMKRPSSDRIDNSKGYSLDNIQLVTFRENLINALHERKGKIYGLNGHPIYMMDCNKKILAYFCSVRFAGICLKISYQSIQGALKTGRKCRGFFWKLD